MIKLYSPIALFAALNTSLKDQIFLDKECLRFIPNTSVLVTWGQKLTIGQLSDFIKGCIEGNILNQQALYSVHELVFILQDHMSIFIQILHP